MKLKTKWMEKNVACSCQCQKNKETMRSEPNRWWFTKHFFHYTFRWKWTRKLVKIRGNRISAYYYIVSNGTMWLNVWPWPERRARAHMPARKTKGSVGSLFLAIDKVQRRGISCRSLTRFDGHKNKMEYIEVYGPMFAIDFHIDNCIVSISL